MPAVPDPHGSKLSPLADGNPRSDLLEHKVSTSDAMAPHPAVSSTAGDMLAQTQREREVACPPSKPFQTSRVLKRSLTGLLALGGGFVAIALWGSSLSYRWLHVNTDYGVVNGRTVTVKAQTRGTLQDMFARPGVSVAAGQPLARIQQVTEQAEFWSNASSLEELALSFQAATLELASKRQELSLLEQQSQALTVQARQLASLSEEDAQLQKALADQAQRQDILRLQQQYDVQQVAVEAAQAKLSEAIAEANAARQSYERYRQLEEQQVIAGQKVDELRLDWETAQSRIESHQAAVAAAKRQAAVLLSQLETAATTAPQPQPIAERLRQHQLETGLQQQQQKLQQAYQASQAQLPGLQRKAESLKYQLTQAQALAQTPPLVDLSAPFSGVVYKTRHDAGEQVEPSDPVLTLLDCEDLWVETLITNTEAERIDEFQPVTVYLKDRNAPVVGQVELMEPVSGLAVIQNREQQLLPALPHNMQQQALTRVTVRLEAAEHVQAANRFCGVGQMASLSFRAERSQFQLALPKLTFPKFAFLDGGLNAAQQDETEAVVLGQD